MLFAVAEGGIEQRKLPSGELVHFFEIPSKRDPRLREHLRVAACSPDGRWLAAAGLDGSCPRSSRPTPGVSATRPGSNGTSSAEMHSETLDLVDKIQQQLQISPPSHSQVLAPFR
jgi:hypothetical protein